MSDSPAQSPLLPFSPPRRVDLHCHSDASNEADEAVLTAIHCPESFSSPADVYHQAKRGGMDFVTITDHDTILGVVKLLDRPDVLVGEELTCYFPQDRCKIHLLVWGLNDDDHKALQAAANNIYHVADIVQSRNLAHSVAHPVYRQNDRLERWHLEHLILLFKGFEVLNGSHSALHRQAFEPLIDNLTAATIEELALKHQMPPRWLEPHIKARTGGSDDHGLLNIGRTWTEFPGEVQTVAQVLDCLRQGRCAPGGEAGSGLKLAHNFYGVGINYYTHKLRGENAPLTMSSVMLQSLIGQRPALRRRDWVKLALKRKVSKWSSRLVRPFRAEPPPNGSALLMDLFCRSFRGRMSEHTPISQAIRDGRAALGEHQAMFDLLSAVNRDVAAGIADSITQSLGRGELKGIFDALSTIAAHQFVQLPYYFALFHQNRERRLLPRLTGHGPRLTAESMKLGVFTDTFDEINGVARFIQDMSRQAQRFERRMIVHTCTPQPSVECKLRKNFTPLLSRPLPCYADQTFSLPPIAEVLEWADRQQFDAIHVHTPGPMGLCGWLVAKMLRIPVLGTYHTDFPRYVADLTSDHRLTTATIGYMKWFYGQTAAVFSRSKDYRGKLLELGIGPEKLATALPGVDTDKFTPEKRDLTIWSRVGVNRVYKLLYAGRVSLEKNLPFLVDAFKQLCARRDDVALVIAGDGPYRTAMQKALAGFPAHFLGFQNDEQLATLYASSDLFVFPSKTDTLGQVVIEAQAAGLPVLVTDQGGPKELMDHQITGQVLPAISPAAWCDAIDGLLNDTPARLRMSRTAPHRMGRFSLGNMFQTFWSEHFRAAVEFDEQMEPMAQANAGVLKEPALA